MDQVSTSVRASLFDQNPALKAGCPQHVWRRSEFLRGEACGYMNLVSGPSRSGDIENTLVTGVHGPGEVHLVLVG